MTDITLYKNGIRVYNPTPRELDYISNNYGNGMDWCVLKDGSYVLYGLFRSAAGVIQDFCTGVLATLNREPELLL